MQYAFEPAGKNKKNTNNVDSAMNGKDQKD